MKKIFIITTLVTTVLLGGCSMLNRPIEADPVHPGNATVSIESTENSLTTATIEEDPITIETGVVGNTGTLATGLILPEPSLSGAVKSQTGDEVERLSGEVLSGS